MMKKLSSRERQLLLLFLLLLFAASITQFFIIPSLDTINRLKEERNQLQQQWLEVEYSKQNQELLTNEVAKLERNVMTLERQIPNHAYTSLFLEHLLEKALDTNIQLVLLQEEKPESDFKQQRIFLQTSGTYDNTIQFVEKLKEIPFEHALSNVQFQTNDSMYTTANFTFYISTPIK